MRWLFLLAMCTMRLAAAAPVYGYVSVNGDNSVYVFDTANDAFVKSISIGAGAGTNSLAITPDGTKIYVTNFTNNTVSVISTLTNSVVQTINVDAGPSSIAATPDGKQIYVTCTAKVDAINTTSNAVTSIAVVATNLTITPDSTKVYLAGPGSNVTVINTSTNTTSATIAVGGSAAFLTPTSDGSLVYVTVGAAVNTVVGISTTSNQVVASYAAGSGTNGIDVTPDGTKVYAARPGASAIAFINVTANTVTQLTVDTGPNYVHVTPNGAKVFANSSGSFNVSSINTSTSGVTPIAVAAFTSRFAITPNGNKVYYIAGGGNELLKDVNATNDTSIGSISLTSDGAIGIVFTPPPLSTVTTSATNSQSLLQSDLVNAVTWTPVDRTSTRTLLGYFIYRDINLTQLAGTTTMPLFHDHNRLKGQTYTYYITAVYADGGLEVLGNVNITD